MLRHKLELYRLPLEPLFRGKDRRFEDDLLGFESNISDTIESDHRCSI